MSVQSDLEVRPPRVWCNVGDLVQRFLGFFDSEELGVIVGVYENPPRGGYPPSGKIIYVKWMSNMNGIAYPYAECDLIKIA